MKILACSDLHGYLPYIEPCDILVLGGDYAPYENHDRTFQRCWFEGEFAKWLASVPAKHIVGIAGNHDFALENEYFANELCWHYLQDKGVKIEGIDFYGVPWVPNLQRWAFHANDMTLHKKYQKVPEKTDVVISHGPPFMIADLSSPRFGSMHCGHNAVNKMLERVQPTVCVSGHIHESHGLYSIPYANTTVASVAIKDDNNEPAYDVTDISHLLED